MTVTSIHRLFGSIALNGCISCGRSGAVRQYSHQCKPFCLVRYIGYSEPEKAFRNCYTWRTPVHFAGFLGLAEMEPITEERLCHQYRVKALPLLGQTVQFQLSE